MQEVAQEVQDFIESDQIVEKEILYTPENSSSYKKDQLVGGK